MPFEYLQRNIFASYFIIRRPRLSFNIKVYLNPKTVELRDFNSQRESHDKWQMTNEKENKKEKMRKRRNKKTNGSLTAVGHRTTQQHWEKAENRAIESRKWFVLWNQGERKINRQKMIIITNNDASCRGWMALLGIKITQTHFVSTGAKYCFSSYFLLKLFVCGWLGYGDMTLCHQPSHRQQPYALNP